MTTSGHFVAAFWVLFIISVVIRIGGCNDPLAPISALICLCTAAIMDHIDDKES